MWKYNLLRYRILFAQCCYILQISIVPTQSTIFITTLYYKFLCFATLRLCAESHIELHVNYDFIDIHINSSLFVKEIRHWLLWTTIIWNTIIRSGKLISFSTETFYNENRANKNVQTASGVFKFATTLT